MLLSQYQVFEDAFHCRTVLYTGMYRDMLTATQPHTVFCVIFSEDYITYTSLALSTEISSQVTCCGAPRRAVSNSATSASASTCRMRSVGQGVTVFYLLGALKILNSSLPKKKKKIPEKSLFLVHVVSRGYTVEPVLKDHPIGHKNVVC